ncbi:MAG: thiamine phosphate synthase [Gammaproteobacteria bacterium]|nr:thiamine phosphate synthase [Gammaproteobacteria bacterium]
MSRLGFPRRGLYAITAGAGKDTRDLLDALGGALGGGARVVQYRDKSTDHVRRRHEARALLSLCHDHDVPLIVNDDVALALEIGADGVHLGRDDGAIPAARERLGSDAIIGASCYDRLELACRAVDEGADYVAFGSFYPSPTKPEAVRAPLSLLGEARARLAVPIVCIGGITPENGARLLAAGGDLLAVIHGIFGAEDPMAAARRYDTLFAHAEEVAQ